MSLGDDVLHALPDLRAAADSLMVDTAAVISAGDDTFDPGTGLVTTGAGTLLYSGPCRMRQPTAQEAEVLFGEEQVTTSRFIACFPHDAVGFPVDAVVTLTASDDADMLSRSFRITGVPMSTFSIYKGYPCEVVE